MKNHQSTIDNRQSGMGWFARLTIVILLAICAAAQQPQPAPPQPQPQSAPQKATPEHRISSEEAKQLLGAVDQVLEFDSQNTGLPIKNEVKRQLIDRDQVQAYIEKQLREDEDAQRLKNGEVVLKKFGLIPRDFSVDTFLVQLMREQVAGYYDPQTKFVNLLNWLPPETQMPVLAHELTHALQDQSFGMEKWVRGPNHKKKISPAETIADDESTVARHAILEGQAMAVMIDWMLAPIGKSLLDSPLIVDAMEAGMAQGGDSPVFSRSPLYLQRILIFPYTYGLDFERVLLKQGKEKAFAGAFKRPPQNTREVMEPSAYLADEKLPALDPPDLAATLGKDWEIYDVGSIGEFDVAVIAEQFGDQAVSRKIYPNWRGGYYYALKKKGSDVKGPRDIGLVFVSRWASADAAKQFMDLYERSIPKRYPGVGGALAEGFGSTRSTGEGWVFLGRSGKLDNVIAIESFDTPDIQKLYDSIAKSLP